MSNGNQMFQSLLQLCGAELWHTADFTDVYGLSYDALTELSLKCKYGRYDYTDFDVAEEQSKYADFNDFIVQNPFVLFNKHNDLFSLIGEFTAVEIVKELSRYIFDCITEDMECEDNIQISSWGDFTAVADCGERLANGNAFEQTIYRKRKNEFELSKFIADGCPNVDLERIANVAVKTKERE